MFYLIPNIILLLKPIKILKLYTLLLVVCGVNFSLTVFSVGKSHLWLLAVKLGQQLLT